MIKEAIGKIVLKENLTTEEMEEVMKEITAKRASTAQISSFLTALRMKGETLGEITVERETILSTAKGFSGGTTIFNVSTATSLVVAGGGQKVVRYVRKSVHPLCGCADVIEALGINLDMTSTQLKRCFKALGICFLHDHLVQNGLEHIMAIRKKIGVRTIFNLLDSLINPGGARVQVLGVYEPDLTETMTIVLRNLGIERGLVVHGEDTLDEISITGKTKVTELKNGETKSYFIQPEDFGMRRRNLAQVKGGTKEQNAEIILEILNGSQGAKRDITVLNSAAAFVIAGKTKDFSEGFELANQSIDSGKALDILNGLIQFTNSESRFLRSEYEMEME
jgi:anthranilate phosphoribosyltransferase